MQQHDDVEVVLDRPAVARLLVAAVAEVLWVADHRQRQVARRLLVADADEIGGVLARVVGDEHALDVRHEVARDAVEHLGQRRRGVVRDDEDADALPHADECNAGRLRATIRYLAIANCPRVVSAPS